jgi:hypothetical protein
MIISKPSSHDKMEAKFIAAVRFGNDAIVKELAGRVSKKTLIKALQIANMMNEHEETYGEFQEIVEFLNNLV